MEINAAPTIKTSKKTTVTIFTHDIKEGNVMLHSNECGSYSLHSLEDNLAHEMLA